MNKYSSMMLCRGDCGEYKPCEHINDCKMCIMNYEDENFNEKYVIGLGQNSLFCKRDHPDFKPLTKKQFFELYKKLPLHERASISIGLLLEQTIIDGTVIGEWEWDYANNCFTR